jgi:hypothetical protein
MVAGALRFERTISMPVISEIAPDTYRISIYVPKLDMQFNHFLVKDDQPILFYTGFRAMFSLMREAVAALIDPAQLRWVGFSHVEADECGALNEWLDLAPRSEPVCGIVSAYTSVNDGALRPARALAPEEILGTGKYRYRYRSTPHLPHGWDAGMFFEETERTLFCSDLFLQYGDVEPLTGSNLVERSRSALLRLEVGPLAGCMAYTPLTKPLLYGLAKLQPRTLAIAHGSSFVGDGARLLRELDQALWEILGATG